MKLNLKNVTLIGIDCVNVERIQVIMDICQKDIDFGAVKLLTSLSTNDERLVTIAYIGSIEEFSRFCIAELVKYVDTDYVLLVQYDGFILNPQSWTDEFLKYDYIGAPWHVADWSVKNFDFPENLVGVKVVGNGGFSLRSKKFLETSAKLLESGKIARHHPEDVSLCVWNRNSVEREGVVFAPVSLAQRFSIEGDEDVYTYNTQFGFHGLSWTNIDAWMEVHPEYPQIVSAYRQAREEHFERRRKRVHHQSTAVDTWE
ncbi:MAG: hypothetical protein UV60_C0013G0023 [Parcubacteria group bacterium GW2011_GWA2_43_11]|nr:MAG: hypothetical protein UV60_C0013G0023 [Parcubacteria group bacterium GW2011_GWA2_43_11]